MRWVRYAAAVLAASLSLSLACGGKKPAKNAMSPTDDMPKDDSDGGSPWGDDGGTGGSSATPPPPAEPVVIACESKPASCAETKASGDDIASAKDRCTKANGEPHDGACSRDNIAGTCEVPDKNLTIFTYADANPKGTKGRVKGAKGGCTSAGGTFTAAAAPTPAKPAGKGGGKGPKKKK